MEAFWSVLEWHGVDYTILGAHIMDFAVVWGVQNRRKKIVINDSRNINRFQQRFMVHFQSFSGENGGMFGYIVYHCCLARDMHGHTAICSNLL